MARKTMYVELTFREGFLGTNPGDPEIYKSYVGSKAPDAASMEEEIEALGVEAVSDKGKTFFMWEDGKPFIWNYMVPGFFKSACGALRQCSDKKSSKLTSYKKKINQLVQVYPRKIFIDTDEPVTDCERSLRAQTAQGDRVALACSEEIHAGAKIRFAVDMLDDSLEPLVREWLTYGYRSGLGQWRNSGKGAFRWKEIDPFPVPEVEELNELES